VVRSQNHKVHFIIRHSGLPKHNTVHETVLYEILMGVELDLSLYKEQIQYWSV